MDNNSNPPKRAGLLQFLRESNGCQFVIPVYQRNYTWTATKEVKQYLDDLKCVIDGKYNRHFLGIMIYLDRQLDFSSREFSVIDGQQRLTTTFLILYAIKKLMLEQKMNDAAAKLENQYLINLYVEDKLKFKLKPLVADDEVYRQIVESREDEIIEKGSNIYKNYVYIIERIKGFLSEGKSFNDILLSLDKLYIVCVPVTSDDSPQKIFESINSTGAKLSASDLIRNYVLMDMDSSEQERLYANYWKRIESFIGGDSRKLELYFRMFLAARLSSLPNTSAVYSVFKGWFSDEIEGGRSVEQILNEICAYAKYYNIIYTLPVAQIDKDIAKSIEEFRYILSEMPAPLLIEMYALYSSFDDQGNRKISAAQFNDIVGVTISYLMRRALCSKDTSDITRLFPVILGDVLAECKGNYSNIVEILKKNLINKQRGKSSAMPTDDEMRSTLLNANMFTIKSTLKTAFIKLESTNNPVKVDFSIVNIEHLMPQTPNKDWLNALNVDEEAYQNNLNRLGNLTLAEKSVNSMMSNKPFEYKTMILKKTGHLKMNAEILALPKWDIEEIDKRTKNLIEELIAAYPYTPAAGVFLEKMEIVLKADNITAIATFYLDDGSVEIMSGSECLKNELDTPEWVISTRQSLLDDGYICEKDDKYIFIKDYLIPTKKTTSSTSLSNAAGILLGGSRNGWEYWLQSDGKPLKRNKELYKRMNEN